jgi:hypothetical protein
MALTLDLHPLENFDLLNNLDYIGIDNFNKYETKLNE